MQVVFYLLSFSFTFVSSDVVFNTSGFQTTNAENVTKMSNTLWNVLQPNGSAVLEVYHKISDGLVKNVKNISEKLEDDFDWLLQINEPDSDSTEGVDADGCDRSLRKRLETRCDEDYEQVNSAAYEIEDTKNKTEALCCAVEDFEKCNLRAFDRANCGKDIAAIKENMKAARLFITIIANVTCSQFRGLCASYSSASAVADTYVVGFGVVLLGLISLFVRPVLI